MKLAQHVSSEERKATESNASELHAPS